MLQTLFIQAEKLILRYDLLKITETSLGMSSLLLNW